MFLVDMYGVLTTVTALYTTKAVNVRMLMTCKLHFFSLLLVFCGTSFQLLWVCRTCRLNRFGIIHLRPKRSPDAAKERNGMTHIVLSKILLSPFLFKLVLFYYGYICACRSGFFTSYSYRRLAVMSWLATLDSRVRVRLATPDIIHSMLSKSLFNKQVDGLLEKKAEVNSQLRTLFVVVWFLHSGSLCLIAVWFANAYLTGKIPVPPLREALHGSRLCAQAHPQQARRQGCRATDGMQHPVGVFLFSFSGHSSYGFW
jgi:hypothetical protein